MNKKQLYESIMKNVSHEVKKALNENVNNEPKQLKDIILDLVSKYEEHSISIRELISNIVDACNAEDNQSEEPIFIEGDTPYIPDEDWDGWEATYKYRGKNYTVKYEAPFIGGADLWHEKFGLSINRSYEDMDDPSMQFFIDKNGNKRYIKDDVIFGGDMTLDEIEDKYGNVDIEKTVPELLKQWVYLQKL